MVYANIGLQANIRYISNQISHMSVHFYLNILIIKLAYILNSYCTTILQQFFCSFEIIFCLTSTIITQNYHKIPTFSFDKFWQIFLYFKKYLKAKSKIVSFSVTIQEIVLSFLKIFPCYLDVTLTLFLQCFGFFLSPKSTMRALKQIQKWKIP